MRFLLGVKADFNFKNILIFGTVNYSEKTEILLVTQRNAFCKKIEPGSSIPSCVNSGDVPCPSILYNLVQNYVVVTLYVFVFYETL